MAISEEVEITVKFNSEYEDRTWIIGREDENTISFNLKTNSGVATSYAGLSDDDADTLIAALEFFRNRRDKEILQAPDPNTDTYSAFGS